MAAILSVAMMLEWLGEATAAADVRRAVEAALAAGEKTVDLGGALSTERMGEAVLQRLARL